MIISSWSNRTKKAAQYVSSNYLKNKKSKSNPITESIKIDNKILIDNLISIGAINNPERIIKNTWDKYKYSSKLWEKKDKTC